MRNLELLAPAGSMEAFKAVIHAGADAVYLGGNCFGARAYAKNLTQEELLEAIDYAHLYGRKVYLAVNTLLKQPEIDMLYDYLSPYYEQGLDAVIVQDVGVLQKIHACFPNLAIHASTQMSVTGAYGAAYLKQFGVSRVVPARELAIKEIRNIHSQTGIELECFVHGALCYCYSGQCLLSSVIGGRSGNRGRCAQACRLPYAILDQQKKELSAAKHYPLSMKDLCTIDKLPLLIQAGVNSFKIEGRMKSAEYAAGVTAVYRKYLDAYLRGEHGPLQSEDCQNLLETGNRGGFTDGYYTQRNGRQMLTLKNSSYTKSTGAYLPYIQAQYVNTKNKIKVHAKALLSIGKPGQMEISSGRYTAHVQYGIVQEAKTKPLELDMVREQLCKTGNTPFIIEEIQIKMDEAVFMPKQMLNELRRRAIEELLHEMLRPYRRAVGRGSHADACAKHIQDVCLLQPGVFASVEEPPQLSVALKYNFIKRLYLDSSMYSHAEFTKQLKRDVQKVHRTNKQVYLSLPSIFRMDTAKFYKEQWLAIEQTGVDGYLAKNWDELGFLDAMQVKKGRCILDHHLYTFSDTAKMNWEQAGWTYDTIPFELNKKELAARNNQTSELVIYGRIPLMTSAQCLKKTAGHCTKDGGYLYLKDRYANEFPTRHHCNECYNTIYNGRPLSLIQFWDELADLHPVAYRLQFTFESVSDVRRILDGIQMILKKENLSKEELQSIVGDYTNGHYKRGVE